MIFLPQQFIKYPREYSEVTDSGIIYTIIGDGDHGELERLKVLVNKLKLGSKVKLMGRVPFNLFRPYFDTHNIEISFVPIIPCFDCQPVIATATFENQIVINENNGVLIDDTIEAFASGVEELHKKQGQYKSKTIREAAQIYHWRLIVSNLEEYLLNVYNSKASISKIM